MRLKLTSLLPALFATAASAALTASVYASEPAPDPAAAFGKADANGDGAVEWSEVLTMREATFTRLDRNGDGVANSDDKPPMRFAQRKFEGALAQLTERFDTNGDGEVSIVEFMDAPAPGFEAADVNNDDVLDAEELEAAKTNIQQARAE